MSNNEALGLLEVDRTVPLSKIIKDRLSVIFSDSRLWLVILINAVFFVYFLYMGLKTGIYADDYGYRYVFETGCKLTDNRVDSLAEVIRSQAAHYRLMNGRSVAHFLLQYVLMWNDTVFDIVNAVVYCLLGVGMYLHTLSARDRKNSRHRPFSQLAVYLIPWVLFPAFGNVFHVECLAANYLWTVTITIWFLLPFRLLLEGRDIFSSGRMPKIGAALMFAAGMAAGWSSENGSAAALFMTGCMGLYYLLRRKPFPMWCASGFGGALFGFIMMIASPGYSIRSDESEYPPFFDRLSAVISAHTLMPYGCLLIILMTCVCFLMYNDLTRKRTEVMGFAVLSAGAMIVVFILNMALSGKISSAYIDLILCIGAAAGFVYLVRRCPADRIGLRNIMPLCYLGGALAANLALSAVPYVQQRSQLPFLVLLTVSAAQVFECVLEKIGRRVKLRGIKQVFIIFLMIYSLVSLHSVSAKTARNYQQFLDMEQSIYNARAAGDTDIVIKRPDPSEDRRVANIYVVNNDPDYWINQAFCQYYGITSVYHEP